MSKIAENMLQILDPFSTIRLWTVSYGGWNGGWFKSFWLKSSAYRFAKSRNEPFVGIQNEITEETFWMRKPE